MPALLAGALFACTESAPPAPLDAGAPPALTADGIRVPVPSTWRLEAAPELTPPVQAHGAAVAPSDGPMPPKLVLTTEPLEGPPEPAFAKALAEVERLGERSGVEVERSGFGTRRVGSVQGAFIEARYRVGDPGVRFLHRALLLPRDRTMITLTATFLATDRERVEPELELILQGIELTGATGATP